jgi:hypothetical protein
MKHPGVRQEVEFPKSPQIQYFEVPLKKVLLNGQLRGSRHAISLVHP